MNYEHFCEIICNDNPDYEAQTESVIVSKGRWDVYYSRIFKNSKFNTYYEAYWSEPATEYQEGQPKFWSIYEVEPYEKTIISYARLPKPHIQGYSSD